MMYSASIAPHFKAFGGRWKLLCAYLLTDQAYAVSVIRFTGAPDARNKLWYFLGCATPLWVTWQAGTLVGVLLGMQVPRSWSLDFAIPLTFMAILIPSINDRAAAAAAVAAGLAAVVGFHLPYHTGIIVAALCGIFTGAGIEWAMEKRGGS
jgi:predicted branched-subunit amino acid permease